MTKKFEILSESDDITKIHYNIISKKRLFFLLFLFGTIVYQSYSIYQTKSNANNFNDILYSNEFFYFCAYNFAALCQTVIILKGIIIKESIILMKNVGIQLEKKNALFSTSKRFIDITRIRDIIIYEFVDPCKVRNILAQLLYDYHETVPMLDTILDKRNLLKTFVKSRTILGVNSKVKE